MLNRGNFESISTSFLASCYGYQQTAVFLGCMVRNPILQVFWWVFFKILSFLRNIYMMLCAIWYHLYNLKNLKNTHGGVLLLLKLQTKACNLTKSNKPPWVFFTFFKLKKWYQIAQNITYRLFCGGVNQICLFLFSCINCTLHQIGHANHWK